MERSVRSIGLLLIFVMGLVLGVFGGVFLDREVLSAFVPIGAIPKEAAQEFELMGEAWNTIHKSFVGRDTLEDRDLTYGAIGGMVDALGDTGHSRFLTPEIVKQEDRNLQAEFEGIGATVEKRNEQVVIVAPIDGSPAQKAGLKPGDVILEVNGEDLTGLTLTEAVEKILGPAGTQVTLTILDPQTGETREVTLTRARITVKNVTWARLPGTELGIVRIAVFSERVSDDLITALEEIQEQNLKGVVLDLRNNPGGLLEEAVDVASQFLSEGTVLRVRDAEKNETTYEVRPGGVATQIPLVVLINQGSASASEIVSGALQDAGRSKLVGEKTFGTGTVLNQFALSDGSAILLATQEWLTPSGRVIWHEGIAPDILVELPPDASPLIPEEIQEMTPEEFQAAPDSQLQKSVEIVQEQVAP